MANTKLDRARVVVLLALAAGSSKHAAAGKAGIAYRTLARWQEEDEFAEAVSVATGQGREVYEALIRQHAEKDWRAAYALYESIYLEQRSKGSTIEPVPVEVAAPLDLSDAEAQERIAKVLLILRKSLGSEEAVQQVVEANVRRLRLVQG